VTLWGYIPDKHIVTVGALPLVARRLDTNELVTDLPGVNLKWAASCGWWNLDTPDVPLLVATKNLSPAEVATLTAERNAAIAERDIRRQWIDDIKQAWAIAKSALADFMDVEFTIPPAVPPTGAQSLGLHTQQIDYLFRRVQYTDRILYGGGTIQTPGIADALIAVTEALESVIEQSAGLELST
jgi:hypothetical protein